MINIIGNTCIASWITTKILQQQFVNPFTWCILSFNDAFYLIDHYESINWAKFAVNWDINHNEIVITVDGNLNIIYPHYKFDASATSPHTENTNDVYYNKIWEYAATKYVTRCHRLIHNKTKPRFIFTTPVGCTHSRAYYTNKQQSQLADLYETKYGRTDGQTRLVLSFPDIIVHPYVISIQQSIPYGGNTLKMAKDIYDKLPVDFWSDNE